VGAPEPPELELPHAKIYSNSVAFAALKADGSITAWGNSSGALKSSLVSKPHAVIEPSALRAAKALSVE
jgi:hypothetical protein